MIYLQEASKKVKDNQLKKLEIKKATKIRADGYRIKNAFVSPRKKFNKENWFTILIHIETKISNLLRLRKFSNHDKQKNKSII